ncbi:hypothetical protein EI427_17640 [Flammeovirga pectinis]|uniref:Uncharacterized protein n=1 Tax=Flammeovirga pectinis TaxID=2494373 RepID=A0A3S9P6Z7_9BACT|nr:hypothetical protein [Flammeovirga pectinis]AZQ63980.1 hypothetical protein EI427_17640 [Flammeovirga pectinis]
MSLKYLFFLCLIGYSTTEIKAQNTPPEIHSLAIVEATQGEQGVIQKLVKGFAIDKEDKMLPTYSFKLISGKATLTPLKGMLFYKLTMVKLLQ